MSVTKLPSTTKTYDRTQLEVSSSVTPAHRTAHSISAVWQQVGLVSLAGSGHRLTMPAPIPTDAGVYTITAQGSREIYVGEGADLSRRLKNYENAGWMPNTFSRTNRTVQGWIFEGITTKRDTFQIHVCTEAHFSLAGSESIRLNFQQKYYRVLVEAATIAAQRELTIKNKQFVQ